MTKEFFSQVANLEQAFPKPDRRLRLGVVGGGRISQTQAMAARQSDRWEIVAGALSSNKDKAKALGAEWYLDDERCYTSFVEMAQQEAQHPQGVDAVMITTPNHVHFDAAKVFIENGIDILCDKPLTNEVDEAVRLADLTRQSGLIFGVGYAMSCFAMIRQAKEIVANGGIGKINQIHVEFMQDWMTPDDIGEAEHVKWRLDPKKSGATSCTGDIATHAAHLATFVSGLPMTHLRAEMHVCGSPKPLEDTVFMNTRFANDVPGTLMATRLAPGNRGGLRLRIFGSEGGIEWDLEHSEYLKHARFGEPDRILSRGHGHGISSNVERLVRTGRGFPEGLIEAWANLYTEFATAVAARRDGLTLPNNYLAYPDVEDGAEGVKFIHATVQSNSAGGNWVEIT